jgi:sugar O-acyltransferase (sialic acid O-acetyltransferase NeuD family)
VSAGGFGRTIASLARSDIAFGKSWDIKGFLDNRPHIYNPTDLPIVGDPLSYQVQEGDIFLCALGKPADKRRFTEGLLGQDADFIKLQTSMHVGERAFVSRGCIFERDVSLGADVYLGQFVTILSTTIVGYDVKIGDFCQIGSFVFIGGSVRIGNDVVIHPHSTILPGVKIGDGVTIGAGSVVIHDVESGTTVFGNPAKPFSFR